jgi:hypothetical protein
VVSQLKVNEIIKQSGSSITIGADGDTLTGPFSSKPIVLGYQSSDQSLTKGSDNKIINWTTTLDTDSAFSSNKFTVPSGKAGNYYISYQLSFDGDSSGNTGYDLNAPIIYKNGSEIIRHNNVREPQIPYGSFAITCVLALVASDYIEFYFHPDRGGGTAGNTQGESTRTWFQIFRLSA